jgi:hypothetical protein
VLATSFPGCQIQLRTWEYMACAIPSLDAKVMNYFILLPKW